MDKCIPSDEDWGCIEKDQDIVHAYQFFSGKDNKEVQEDFRKNVLMRCFDIGYMPVIPFRYYILGLRDFICSEVDGYFEKATAVDCFISLIEDKLFMTPEYICPIWNELVGMVENITNRQKDFDADVDIYGDFQKRFKKILELINNNCISIT